MSYKIKLNSIYICVKDRKRAIDFYEQILGQKITDESRNIFVVNGIRLMLYDFRRVNDAVQYGDNCLPSFEVDDIKEFIEKLEQLGVPIVFPLTRIDDNWVLEFRDTEGNDIEVYSKCRYGADKNIEYPFY